MPDTIKDFIYIQKEGVTQKTDANGKPIGDNGAISGGLGKQEIISEEYDFDGNALTFLLTSDANTEGYGYYAVISHTDIVVKDSDGNIVDFKDGLLPIENGIVTAKVNKVDIADGKALSGAKLQILDKDGRVVEEWVSDGKDHEIKGLIIGETYTLHEETAPDGYTVAQDETFSIDENGEVTYSGTMAEDGTLLLKDKKVTEDEKTSSKDSGSYDNTGTGDNSHTVLWTTILLMACAALLLTVKREKKT